MEPEHTHEETLEIEERLTESFGLDLDRRTYPRSTMDRFKENWTDLDRERYYGHSGESSSEESGAEDSDWEEYQRFLAKERHARRESKKPESRYEAPVIHRHQAQRQKEEEREEHHRFDAPILH